MKILLASERASRKAPVRLPKHTRAVEHCSLKKTCRGLVFRKQRRVPKHTLVVKRRSLHSEPGEAVLNGYNQSNEMDSPYHREDAF